ncbi:uncharacterized protein LOC128264623 [Drosophila gunungcola]|uniref:Uncharacterized protein n=1 Tax=Drosophila gunungcola TaxID=103775 RepID=A0A9P9YCS5_9MUSC|nr:uncharacterized protein LOC128264623 [Drosophila gunungcola]KAI8034320.1 hypothetical protein M5D96_012873 [Drosophila gunungcola]
MFRSKEIYAGVRVSFLLLCLTILLMHKPVDARWTRRPRRTTTPRSTTKNPDRHQHVHHWPSLVPPPAQPQPHPQVVVVQKPSYTESSPRLIDSFDQRSIDGQYEFRYQLDNGNTRYERAYWLPVGKDLVLAKKGYYSVPLPNDKYSTVFYTADHRGYHVDMQTLSEEQPLLPRNLEVPGMEREMGTGAGTGSEIGTGAGSKRNSISDPERNELDVEVDENVDASEAGTELVPNASNQVETETEPSTLANDILATEAPADSHVEDDDDVDDDEGASN